MPVQWVRVPASQQSSCVGRARQRKMPWVGGEGSGLGARQIRGGGKSSPWRTPSYMTQSCATFETDHQVENDFAFAVIQN